MMTTEDIQTITDAKEYLDGLMKYYEETGDDDWFIMFLQKQLSFRTDMKFEYNEAHKRANAYRKELQKEREESAQASKKEDIKDFLEWEREMKENNANGAGTD